MKGKPAIDPPHTAPTEDSQSLHGRVRSLEMELEQKNVLLEQGFAAFTQAAEKLQESHKRLQVRVAELNLELGDKNQELERNLEEREKVKAYLSNIFESLPVGVFVTDLEGVVTSANRAGLDMTRAHAEQMVGQTVNEVLGSQLLLRAPDGTLNLRADLLGEEPYTFHPPDGEPLKMQVSLTPMTGEGRELGYILNAQDVTQLKQLEEQAQRRNRFTAMGEMAANIAHEIRNPLGSIELFASLVKRGLPEEDEKHAMMNHIAAGISNMNHIISNVLEYTKPRPVNLRRLDLHRLLEEMAAFSRYMAEQNGVEISLQLEADSHMAHGDEDLLRQVFHNMVLNAVQAMTEGGTLTVVSRNRTLSDPKQLARFSELPRPPEGALETVLVGFRDNGSGIPKEVQERIFDPFFTTKARGTGLGLAIVHNITESHHATVEVESRPGKGTEFTFTFPVAQS